MTDFLNAEDKLDKMQLEIDREAVRLLTVYSPVAGDLRYVLSVIMSTRPWSGSEIRPWACVTPWTAPIASPNSAVLPTLIAMGERAAVMSRCDARSSSAADADLPWRSALARRRIGLAMGAVQGVTQATA